MPLSLKSTDYCSKFASFSSFRVNCRVAKASHLTLDGFHAGRPQRWVPDKKTNLSGGKRGYDCAEGHDHFNTPHSSFNRAPVVNPGRHCRGTVPLLTQTTAVRVRTRTLCSSKRFSFRFNTTTLSNAIKAECHHLPVRAFVLGPTRDHVGQATRLTDSSRHGRGATRGVLIAEVSVMLSFYHSKSTLDLIINLEKVDQPG